MSLSDQDWSAYSSAYVREMREAVRAMGMEGVGQ